MKTIRTITMLVAAILLATQLNAQTSKTSEPVRTVSKPAKEVQKTEAKGVKNEAKNEKAEGKHEKDHHDEGLHKGQVKNADKGKHIEHDKEKSKEGKKPADGRTKTGDKVNHSKKGPNGETIYTGERGGNYYLDKKGNKNYIKE